MSRTQIKICCIGSIEEAQTALDTGAHALGLVSEMPSGPGVIDEDLISVIAAAVPAAVGTFLLTSLTSAVSIFRQQQRCGTNTIQLCDRLPISELRRLRDLLPGIRLVYVVHVSGRESIAEASLIEEFVDAVLLDTGSRSPELTELGGTGRTHDWNLSAHICRAAKKPVFLAGGLRPDNIREAVNIVRPFGVDVCSGVRTDDRLDVDKLRAFIEKVNDA